MAPGALMSHDRRVDHTDAMTFADAWVTASKSPGTYLGSDANPAGVTAR